MVLDLILRAFSLSTKAETMARWGEHMTAVSRAAEHWLSKHFQPLCISQLLTSSFWFDFSIRNGGRIIFFFPFKKKTKQNKTLPSQFFKVIFLCSSTFLQPFYLWKLQLLLNYMIKEALKPQIDITINTCNEWLLNLLQNSFLWNHILLLIPLK